MAAELLTTEIAALPTRKITEQTCRHFGYGTGVYKGQAVQIAPYYNAEGQLVAQKVRGRDKKFAVVGDISEALPFGAHLWQKGGRKIVVTEGEIDALTMSQVQGNKWPVVSISCGADKPADNEGNPLPGTKIKKYFAKHRGYFNGFDEVILMFDTDEQGRFSAQVAAKVLGSRAKIAELPGAFKDPNEMLLAGKTAELIDAMWKAQPYRPEGIVAMSSLREEVLKAPSWGLSYGWKGMDNMTYGAHTGEIVTLVAGTGVGKTDVLMQVVSHLVTAHGESVGGFMLESSPVAAAKILCGKVAGKRFHIPNPTEGEPLWTDEELTTAFDTLTSRGKVFLYDSFGANDWAPIKDKIEYLYHAEGVRYFVLDHLTALTAGEEDQRQALDTMMEDMASVVVKLGITIFLVSHLNRPQGTKAHEEGARVTLAHLRNSGAIAMWSWIVLALERDQQATDDLKRFTTTVRCLKQRRDGSKVGDCFYIRYDTSTGRLNEVDDPEAPSEEMTRDESATPGESRDF